MSFHDRLIGKWSLVHYRSVSVDDPNDILCPIGEDCEGTITYVSDGTMSASLQTPSSNTEDDNKSTPGFKIEYSGTFNITNDTPSSAILTTKIIESNPAEWRGREETQPASMVTDGENDKDLYLVLTTHEAVVKADGMKRMPNVRWVKVEELNGSN